MKVIFDKDRVISDNQSFIRLWRLHEVCLCRWTIELWSKVDFQCDQEQSSRWTLHYDRQVGIHDAAFTVSSLLGINIFLGEKSSHIWCWFRCKCSVSKHGSIGKNYTQGKPQLYVLISKFHLFVVRSDLCPTITMHVHVYHETFYSMLRKIAIV